MRPLKRPSKKLQKAWENETSTIAAKNHLDDALKHRGIQPKDLDSKEHFKPAWGEPKWWKEAMVVAQDEQCAWCTVKPGDGEDSGTIDHIRPKTEVHRHFERRTPNSKKRTFLPKGGLRPAYYWLAYDPKNFAFTCRGCNLTAKITLWPVRPWKNPSAWKAPYKGIVEKELILDPFVRNFNPFNHFQFAEFGAMVPRQNNERAEATRDTLQLDRTSLCGKREKAIERVELDVQSLKRAGSARSAAVDETRLVIILANNCSWKSSHAAYYRAALKNALHSAGLTWSFLRDAWDQLGLAADVTEPPDDAWI